MTPTDDQGAQTPAQTTADESISTRPDSRAEEVRGHAHATEKRSESDAEPEYFFLDPDTIEELARQNRGAPLSDFLGLPVLWNKPPKSELFQSDAKVSFGFKLLSSSQTSLSSMLGLPLLKSSTGKSSSMGMPLLSDNPAPLSSKIGLPLLKQSKPKANLSSGTVSSKVGVRTLTD